MLEQLKYKNHLNEVFEFGKDGIFVDMNDLHDYEWTVTQKGNRIAALDYAVSKRKLPVKIICDTEANGIAARNKLFEVTEKDVLAMQHGQIILGDYYFRCFVTKSEKKNYLTTKRHIELTLTLTSDFPYWVKESKFRFGKAQAKTRASTVDFPFDYPFDYCHDIVNKTVNNIGIAATNFKMVIYGQCSNPVINIGGNRYQVNCTIGESEYLTIDSFAKTITLTASDGTQFNRFSSRNRDSYIFEKIQPGNNVVAWDGSFGFDVTLFEERSEPKWI